MTGSNAGSDHTVEHSGSGEGSSVVTPPPVNVVSVIITTEPETGGFEVLESGAKVPGDIYNDGLPITDGKARTIVIHAKGFKDKRVTIDGKKKRILVPIDRAGGGTHITPPPAGPDCSTTIIDAKSKHCRDQYCAHHSDDPRCDAE